jgi:hypothetical protein
LKNRLQLRKLAPYFFDAGNFFIFRCPTLRKEEKKTLGFPLGLYCQGLV